MYIYHSNWIIKQVNSEILLHKTPYYSRRSIPKTSFKCRVFQANIRQENTPSAISRKCAWEGASVLKEKIDRDLICPYHFYLSLPNKSSFASRWDLIDFSNSSIDSITAFPILTLNTYTHLGLEDAEDELKRLRTCKTPEKNWNGRKGRGRCHRRCLRRYRIERLKALWCMWGVFIVEKRRKWRYNK